MDPSILHVGWRQLIIDQDYLPSCSLQEAGSNAGPKASGTMNPECSLREFRHMFCEFMKGKVHSSLQMSGLPLVLAPDIECHVSRKMPDFG